MRNCSNCDRLQNAGLIKDKKYLAVQREIVDLKGALNVKDAAILKIKHKLWENDSASKKTVAAGEGELQEQKDKLNQKNQIINQLLLDNNKLKIFDRDLQSRIQRLNTKAESLHTVPKATHVPRNPNYTHPHAPRGMMCTPSFQQKRLYLPGTGRV